MNDKTLNLYWPVYKNLEKETLELADCIHFSDDQLNVYSMHMADLIVRCVIEIEAISKELYKKVGGNMEPVENDGKKRDLYFDTDCISLLENKWRLSQKKVIVSAFNFYFTSNENIVLTPLKKADKRGTSGCKWKRAYQAVKHNRKESLKLATIENLIHAMGALYILNLYYRDQTFSIGYEQGNDFDNRVGSEMFSVIVFPATSVSFSEYFNDTSIINNNRNNIDEAVYIKKYEEESIKKMYKAFCTDHEISKKNFINSQEIREFLVKNPNYKIENIMKTCLDVGGIEFVNRIACRSNFQSVRGKVELIVNKHITIYPAMHIEEM